ncbi:MAG: MFS transporter [Acidobacteria bacterium]|nr:MFS transporter [Acidobacteriota bacterium]
MVPCVVPGPLPPLHRQVRWWILTALFLATVINFVDRQALSVAAPLLRDQFRLSNQDYGFIVSAFMFGMLTAEFPMGWIMDRFGVRRGFSFAILWWSLANAMHAFGSSRLQFAALRYWLGTGECGNFSGGMKVVAQWFPPHERALATGIFNGGAMVGSVIALPLLSFLIVNYGWRASFLVPSLFGFVWVLLWLKVYHPPTEHPRVTPAELQHIAGPPAGPMPRNRTLLRHPQVWGLMLSRFFIGPVVQFYIFWTPEFLFRQHGLNIREIGLFGWLPFLFGDIGSVGGGWLAGWLMRRGMPLERARRLTMGIGAACCLLSVAVVLSQSAGAAIAFICLVLAGHTCLSANMFAAIADLMPPAAAGRATGLTGIAGGLSGMAFPILTGYLVDKVSYTPVFILASLMPLIGTVLLFALGRGLKRVAL